MNLKRRRSNKKEDEFVRLTTVPFLSASVDTTQEVEIPTVSCISEVSSLSSVECKEKKEKKKKKMGRKVGGTQMDETPQNAEPSLNDQLESAKTLLKKTKPNGGITKKSAGRPLKNKKAEHIKATLRRSNCVQNTLSKSLEPIVETIEAGAPLTENKEASEGGEDHPCSHEGEKVSDATNAKSTDEKIANLSLLVEEQRTLINAFLSEGADRSMNRNAPVTDTELERSNYKYMYINSQKQITELKEQNSELKKKLEVSLAKLEGYEKGQVLLSETIGQWKDSCLVSTLAKTTEMMFSLSSSRGFAAQATNPEAIIQGTKRLAIAAKKKTTQPTENSEATTPAAILDMAPNETTAEASLETMPELCPEANPETMTPAAHRLVSPSKKRLAEASPETMSPSAKKLVTMIKNKMAGASPETMTKAEKRMATMAKKKMAETMTPSEKRLATMAKKRIAETMLTPAEKRLATMAKKKIAQTMMTPAEKRLATMAKKKMTEATPKSMTPSEKRKVTMAKKKMTEANPETMTPAEKRKVTMDKKQIAEASSETMTEAEKKKTAEASPESMTPAEKRMATMAKKKLAEATPKVKSPAEKRKATIARKKMVSKVNEG